MDTQQILKQLNNKKHLELESFGTIDNEDIFDEIVSNLTYKEEYIDYDNLFLKLKQTGLNVITFNICSLQAKFDELKDLIYEINKSKKIVHIIGLQEIWNVSHPEYFTIPDYNLYINQRVKHKGGGVGFYVHTSLDCTVIPHLTVMEEFVFESIAVEIKIENESYNFVNYYKSNNAHHSLSISDFTEYLAQYLDHVVSLVPENTFILSDSNINLLCKNSRGIEDYLNTLYSFGYFPIFRKATRIQSNNIFSLIDHVFVSNPNIITCALQNIQNFSDHNMLYFNIENRTKNEEKSKIKYQRQINCSNIEKFKNLLVDVDWNFLYSCDDINIAAETFNRMFKANFEKCFPLKKFRLLKNKCPIQEFMNKKLLKLRKQKRKLMAIAKLTKDTSDLENFKKVRNDYNRKVKQAKAEYFHQKIKTNRNPKELWKNLKNFTNLGKGKDNEMSNEIENEEGILIRDPTEIANSFNKFFMSVGNMKRKNLVSTDSDFRQFLGERPKQSCKFFLCEPDEVLLEIEKLKNKTSQDIAGVSSKFLKQIAVEISAPLCYIYNLSLSTGTFPNVWKTSHTVPIFKDSGDRTNMSNYRPVGIISAFSKILEKIVYSRVYTYLERNNFFFKCQFGFRENKNVPQALVKVLNYIAQGLNTNKHVILLLLDVSKAYDCVDYQILFEKMENAGIRGICLDWFRSYLTDRKQTVKINNKFADLFLEITIGVIQGSSLSSLLFLIYINDLFRCTKLFSVLFADDSSFGYSHKNLEILISDFNKEIKKVLDWFRANKLTLNFEKTKAILFSNSSQSQNQCPPIFIDTNSVGCTDPKKVYKIKLVEQNDSVRLLGLWIDPLLTFKEFSKKICKKLSFALFAMRKLRNTLNSKVMKLLYNSFFHSHLEFSSLFLLSLKHKEFSKVVNLQKQAIRLIYKLPRKSHTAEAFYTLDILPFEVLCKFNAIKFMTNIKTNSIGAFRGDWLSNHEISGRTLRHSEEYYIPKSINSKTEKLPLTTFAKIMNECLKQFQSTVICEFEILRSTLLKKYYDLNECNDSVSCFICLKMSEARVERDKKLKEKEERIRKLIKEKGLEKKGRIDKVKDNYKNIFQV